MKRVPASFPSSSSLQPIPSNTYPNIHGNINSTSSVVTYPESAEGGGAPNSNTTVPPVTNDLNSPANNHSLIIGMSIAGLILLFAIIYLIRKIISM